MSTETESPDLDPHEPELLPVRGMLVVVGLIVLAAIVATVVYQSNQAAADDRRREANRIRAQQFCATYIVGSPSRALESADREQIVGVYRALDPRVAEELTESCKSRADQLQALQDRPPTVSPRNQIDAPSTGGDELSCYERIYAITHSGLYSDEEENELIRAINLACNP